MSAPHLTEEDVGTYWLGREGGVWQLISYRAVPTVCWERIDEAVGKLHRDRRDGAVGSLHTEDFVRLVPETDAGIPGSGQIGC